MRKIKKNIIYTEAGRIPSISFDSDSNFRILNFIVIFFNKSPHSVCEHCNIAIHVEVIHTVNFLDL
jgi:hypothetical protein